VYFLPDLVLFLQSVKAFHSVASSYNNTVLYIAVFSLDNKFSIMEREP